MLAKIHTRFLLQAAVNPILSTLNNTTSMHAAAVLIPLVNRLEPQLLLTQRALHLRHHAGQIAFPGGRKEPSDCSLITTALRETQEEIGITADHIQIWGTLPTISTVSGYSVTPVIGLVQPEFVLHADTDEVRDIFELPLANFLALSEYREWQVVHQQNRVPHSVYAIAVNQKIIWGATAAILRSFVQQIT
ncbi:MAG: CoA pyrophosphatase [Plesiomonas sp.]|uniref:CoA pyrophosphatase n=1 Tax=Plesiomonas sp. TaxID=2486279 RepID=UPI003F3A2CF6